MIDLQFLGRGAGFNPAEGSNSAWFMESNKLFLIDCGESVFRIIFERKIIDTATELNLFITHTHSDHVGSLGTLILYAYMEKKIPVNIIIDDAMIYLANIKTLLKIYGLKENMYNFIEAKSLDGIFSVFSKVRYIKTMHCDELDSCGLLFETKAGLVFYSSDMRVIDPVMDLINSGRPIDKIYVDTNSNKGPHHLSLQELKDTIPEGIKSKIHCMHLNNNQCMSDALAWGFTVVETV